MKRFLFCASAAIILLAAAGSAQAATCNASSKEELLQNLARYSDYKGPWQYPRDGTAGRIWFKVVIINGTHHMKWWATYPDTGSGRWVPKGNKDPITATGRTTFEFTTNGKQFRLEQRHDCAVTGTEILPNNDGAVHFGMLR